MWPFKFVFNNLNLQNLNCLVNCINFFCQIVCGKNLELLFAFKTKLQVYITNIFCLRLFYKRNKCFKQIKILLQLLL